MRPSARVAVCCAVVLLLAVPATFACGELGSMTSQCPMAEMSGMSGTAGMSGSMSCSTCPDSAEESATCCDLRSAPEPMQALSVESARLLVALEVTDQLEVAPGPAETPPPRSFPAEAFRLHALGRYTLYSSFLL